MSRETQIVRMYYSKKVNQDYQMYQQIKEIQHLRVYLKG